MMMWMRLMALFLLLAPLLGGCAATERNVTAIRESGEVTRAYRDYRINPDYNYFYAGVELQPDAIMGIDKRYTVQSEFWKPVELSEEQLQYWVKWGDRERDTKTFATRYLGNYVGAYIVDPAGSVIGDWYSKKDRGLFAFPGGDVIIPYPPQNRAGSMDRRFRHD